jgi:hypothetical protein
VPKLSGIITLQKAYALTRRDDPEFREFAIVDLPYEGANPAAHDGFEQSHAFQISQVDAAPLLTLVCSTEVVRPMPS